jgi:hypothetical protein
MKFKQMIVALGVFASLILLVACGPQAKQEPDQSTQATQESAQGVKFDRQGLLDLMGKYLAALVKHDPSAVPFADKVKFTESTAEIPVGKGLWVTASGGPSEFQIYAADPVAQQVACLVMMKEINKDILLGARLKYVNGKITEAEHLVIRDLGTSPMGQGALANLQKPRPGLLEDVAPSERMMREQLLKIGLTYYDALTGEDGKLAPFANECERHENGATTAGGKPPEPKAKPAAKEPAAKPNPEMEKMMKEMASMPRTCEGQISTGAFSYITEIKPRRVLIADVQKGLAVGFSMFYHDSSLKEYKFKAPNGEVSTRPSYQGTFNLPAMHIYKIKSGKIYDIEAIGFTMPYGLKLGWE